MFSGRGKYWAKVAAIATVSLIGIYLLAGFVLTFFPHGNAKLVFTDEPSRIAERSDAAPTLPPAPQIAGGNLANIDFGDYDQELAQFVDLEMGESRLDSIDKIRLYFAPEPGTNMVNMTSSTFERDDGSVMLFARNNIPDDAIFAEEVYAVFSGPGDAEKFDQKLAAYGLRLKCRRGENAMEWTTELCP